MLWPLRNAAWWVWALALGSLFGAATIVYDVLTTQQRGLSVLLRGLVAGAIYGVLLGPVVAKQRARLRDVVDVPAGKERQTSRAASRGPLPADAAVRRAALQLVNHRLAEQQRFSFLSVGGLGLLCGGFAYAAFVSSPWFAIWALATAGAVAAQFEARARFRRRAVLLGSSDEANRLSTG